MVEQKRLLMRLNLEIASLESIPEEAERQQALDDIRQDYIEYEKLVHELHNLNSSTETHLISLLRRGGQDEDKEFAV